jgi:riboflavin kinase/FMN adenylyltransferase
MSGVPDDVGSIVTVGTFDGIHLGHWTILREISERAQVTKRRSVLVTFEPHPLKVLRPESAVQSLTTSLEKKEILTESGLQFVKEILVERFHVEELVIGHDHGFGRDRSGNVDTLRELGAELGFQVDVVEPVEAGGAVVSSSRIRAAVDAGRMDEVELCLGRPYSICGTVIYGEKRGRHLGFPTANLSVADKDKLMPRPGIYAVQCRVEGERYPGALHLGPRPTFKGLSPSVEVHLLDFDRDIYGSEVTVEFVEFLREIVSFDSPQRLIAQMGQDVQTARRAVDERARSV